MQEEYYSSNSEYQKELNAKIAKRLAWGFIAFLILIVLMNTVGMVGAGKRGVLTQFSAVTGNIKGEGLYFKVPFIQSIHKMTVQTQKEQVEATSASKDLQNVHAVIALNYRVNPESVATIYQTVGVNFKENIIDPAIQESVKAITANFTAEELITKREAVREDIKSLLAEKMQPRGIVVEDLNIVNFNFSDSFNTAIEAKVTAEQNALAAKNKLEQVKFEAEQNIAEAKGKAEALQIEGNALAQNPQVKELRAIEKWNGVLPQVVGGATPFINVK